MVLGTEWQLAKWCDQLWQVSLDSCGFPVLPHLHTLTPAHTQTHTPPPPWGRQPLPILPTVHWQVIYILLSISRRDGEENQEQNGVSSPLDISVPHQNMSSPSPPLSLSPQPCTITPRQNPLYCSELQSSPLMEGKQPYGIRAQLLNNHLNFFASQKQAFFFIFAVVLGESNGG